MYYRIEYKRGPNYGWETADTARYGNAGLAQSVLAERRGKGGLWKKNLAYRVVQVEETVTEVQ